MSGKCKKRTECRMLGQPTCENNIRSAPVAITSEARWTGHCQSYSRRQGTREGTRQELAKERVKTVWQGERSPRSVDVMKLAHAVQAGRGLCMPVRPRQLFSV